MIFHKKVLFIFWPLISLYFQVTASDHSLNEKPVIISNFAEKAKVNVGYTCYLQARDKDNDSLIFESMELPGWLNLIDSCNGKALLSGIPDYIDAGDNEVIITVTDNIIEEPVMKKFVINVEQIDPPHFTLHPKSLEVVENEEAKFIARAEGLNIRYQWQKNNKDIMNRKDSAMVLEYASITDNKASFRCIATNQGGSDTSYAGILKVEEAEISSVYNVTQVHPINSKSPVLTILPGSTENLMYFLIRPEINWTSASFKIYTVSGKCVYTYIIEDLDSSGNQSPLKVTWDRMSISKLRYSIGKLFAALSVHTTDSEHNLVSVISFLNPS